MKLHIGCGDKYLPGYKHLDIIEREHIDYITSADDLSMIKIRQWMRYMRAMCLSTLIEII